MEHTPNGRVVDTRHAVVLDYIDGCLIEHPEPGNPMYAFALAGTISGSSDRARCVYLFSAEGASLIIDRIINLASMISPSFTRTLLERVQQLPAPPDPDLHTEQPLTTEDEESVQQEPVEQDRQVA